MAGVGPLEILLLLGLVLLLLGPARLPMLGRSLGKGLRELRSSLRRGASEARAQLDGVGSDARLEAPEDESARLR
ncbi:MAG TPA: twin-arginine translocase TatA/TatE family subunit [Gaiellaceae bacterium]|nr:twin-arginine translocase TatA/TatE family subunit [Gaiellaceae bacterium]